MSKTLKQMKAKSRFKHQQLVEVELLADIKKQEMKAGAKFSCSHADAKVLVDAKRVKILK